MHMEKLNQIISDRAGKNPPKSGSEYTKYLVVREQKPPSNDSICKFNTNNFTSPTTMEVNQFYRNDHEMEIYILSFLQKCKEQKFPLSPSKAIKYSNLQHLGRHSVSLYRKLWLCNIFNSLKDDRLVLTFKCRAKESYFFPPEFT